ncbi:XRE family transcriptional regulator [Acinetobacter bereziniae]|uniref:XRE family transcriptional regulator n=1 Tax=Acinetobacter bereziniae TaxID=106648 RepID=UPI00190019A1|nr:XRE family transcriptional regulator [Acinetobacter bereziniae]MBJ8476604.1 helix-turn-helix transcriptional regulator [Acinetobacter bereziniae]
MKSLAERLKYAMEVLPVKKIKGVELARAVGVKPPSVSDWLSGKSKTMEGENLLRAAKHLNVNPVWLATGSGEVKSETNKNSILNSNGMLSSSLDALDNNVIPLQSKLLPVLSWVQAGSMTSVEAINPTEISEWLPPLSADDPDGCFYLKVVGISNFPTYMDGDYILVNPKFQVFDLLSEDLIVVRNNTDATFKKLIIESDDRKYLQALNPNFQPNIIEFEEGMELVGLVIDAFRPLGGSRPKRVRKS